VTQRRPSKPIEALPETPIVLIVDDDSSVREALGRLFRSVDLEPKLFASVAELMRHKFPDAPCCLVLDIRLPGVSGLDFQTQLVEANIHVPIIMMTGHGDIPMSVRAMKGGAVDFLTKPFRDQECSMLSRKPSNGTGNDGIATKRLPNYADCSSR
jgi:FixJ family two-component response regulator